MGRVAGTDSAAVIGAERGTGQIGAAIRRYPQGYAGLRSGEVSGRVRFPGHTSPFRSPAEPYSYHIAPYSCRMSHSLSVTHTVGCGARRTTTVLYDRVLRVREDARKPLAQNARNPILFGDSAHS